MSGRLTVFVLPAFSLTMRERATFEAFPAPAAPRTLTLPASSEETSTVSAPASRICFWLAVASLTSIIARPPGAALAPAASVSAQHAAASAAAAPEIMVVRLPRASTAQH